MKRFWVLIIVSFIAIAGMTMYHYIGRLKAGDPAPNFSLGTPDGRLVSLSDYSGRPVIIHFWATWCDTCIHEFPLLLKCYDDFSKEGLEVIAISEDRTETPVRSFLKKLPQGILVLFDNDGSVADKYFSFGVPESLLIDRKGVIRFRENGFVNWDKKEIRNLIEQVLSDK